MTVLLAIIFFFKRAFYFCVDNWKVVLPVVLAIVLGLYLLVKWNNRHAKLDQESIIKAQQAIASQEKAKMEEVFAQIEVKDQNIDANIAFSETKKINALAEARKKAREMSREELEDYLEERVNE